MYLIWEEQIGGILYLHKMKIKILVFGILLSFYQEYDILFHSTTNNTLHIIDHHHSAENIYSISTTSNINSLANALKKTTNQVFFSSSSWGKLMHCQELNTLLLFNLQSIQCIEYVISSSFYLSRNKRDPLDIQRELEREKDIMEQNYRDILSDRDFQNI
jgi:hypothetical protein